MRNQQIVELQRIADYFVVRKSVRLSGYGSIVFGAIAVAMGAYGFSINPINGILLLLGVMLLLVGIVNTVKPTPTGILADGISLLAIGGWNLYILVANATTFNAPGNSQPGSFPIIAIFQIGFGIASFSRYKRFANAFNEHPSAASLKQMDEMLKGVSKAKLKTSPDVIQFVTRSFNRQLICKGRLLHDRAIFVMGNGQDAVIAEKHEVEIAPKGKPMLSKGRNATFKLGDRTFSGIIKPDSLERYAAWKETPVEVADSPFVV